jgi:hypothetical protein
LWPLVNMRSFVAVTGPKTDYWLVNTVALLLVASGLTFLDASRMTPFPRPLAFLAVAEAIAIASVSIYYPMRKRISKIYYADAALQILLMLGWLFTVSNV